MQLRRAGDPRVAGALRCRLAALDRFPRRLQLAVAVHLPTAGKSPRALTEPEHRADGHRRQPDDTQGMNVKPIIAPLAVALVTAGTITASAGGAFAATPSPSASAQSTTTSSNRSRPREGRDAAADPGRRYIGDRQRITKLNAAVTEVNADKTLTSSDRSALLSTLQGDLSGMQQLQAKIAADTTASQARTDYTTIFRQYRVLAVALPQERIVRAADRATAAALPRLQAAEQKLSNQLGKQPAKDTSTAKAALADLQQQITAVQSDAQGLDAAALAVTPARFNQSHSAITDVQSKGEALRTAEKAAQKDIRTIRQALRG